MRLCNKCTKVYEDGFLFCPHCGTPVSSAAGGESQVFESTSREPVSMGDHQAQPQHASQKPTKVKYTGLFVGLAVSTLIISFVLITSRNSDHAGTQLKNLPATTSQQNATPQSSVVRSTPIEQQLAVIDGVQSDATKVNRYRSLLKQLARTYSEDEQKIGDVTVKAMTMLEKEGVTESLLNIMEGMNHVYSIGTPNKSYASTTAVYVTLRTRGWSHNRAVSGVSGLVQDGLM